jgi:hypothetical protein
MAKTDDEGAVAALLADYMATTGCDEDYATEVLAMATAGAGLGTADALPRLVATLATPETFPAPMVVTVLAGLTKLFETPNGRELLFYVGMRTARRCGVAPELLDKLQEYVKPSPKETRH